MELQRTVGVVIRVIDHGESDKIVTLYCPVLGKFTAIAKGAKRSKKRFVNKLELFSLLDITFAPAKISLARIDQAELISSYPTLRSYYDRFTAATLICELLLYWSRENDGDQQLFHLLTWTMSQLDKGSSPVLLALLFQLKLFDISGYRPHLSGCVDCSNLTREVAPFYFSAAQNGLVCATCRNNEYNRTGMPLSLGTVKLLNMAQDLPVEKLLRLRFSTASLQEAIKMARIYGSHLLQREIQAWKQLLALQGQEKKSNNNG